MVKIGYDAGHGIYTAGKRTPDGEREWTFNDTVAVAFANELGKYKDVELKRFDDPTGLKDIPLQDRTNGANKWGANYYISFHHNANAGVWFNGGGVETFIYTGSQPKSLELAKAVHPALVKGYGLKDRGIKQKDLHIVRETKMPAILVEGGFMDSTVDIKVLRNKAMLQNAGVLMAQALAKYLNLTLKEQQPVQAQVTNTSDVSLDTFRKEAIAEIKNAVKDGRFTSPHADVEKYSEEDLQRYMLIALARRK